MPSEHARLGPSAAERWLECPASVRLAAELPNTDSTYAREGTLAHECAEVKAAEILGIDDYDTWCKRMTEWREHAAASLTVEQLDEAEEHAKSYAFLLERLRDELGPGTLVFLEERVFPGVPQCFGTGDAVLVSGDGTEVVVVDYKYGAGVKVSPVDNPQLKLYALGALEGFGDVVATTDKVRAVIFQPRVGDGEPLEAAYTAEELRAWRRDVVLPTAELALSDAAPFNPGEVQCRWCPAAGICRPRAEASLAEDFATDPDVLSDDELADVLARLGAIEDWVGAVRKHAMAKVWDHGQPVPGWKVVLTQGRRGITDDRAAVEKLVEAGYERDKVQRVQPETLGKLEKLVGKDKLPAILGDLLRKSDGSRTLVPDTDPRQEVTPASQAALDFTDTEEN